MAGLDPFAEHSRQADSAWRALSEFVRQAALAGKIPPDVFEEFAALVKQVVEATNRANRQGSEVANKMAGVLAAANREIEAGRARVRQLEAENGRLKRRLGGRP